MADAEDNTSGNTGGNTSRNEVDVLRRRKARYGSQIKRARNKLEDAIANENKEEVRRMRDEILDLEDELRVILEDLIDVHRSKANDEGASDVIKELTEIESDNRFLINNARKFLISNVAACEKVAKSRTPERVDEESAKGVDIGRDLWKQLQRVQIPIFSGDKMTFESWRAAFESCVDKAPASAIYKLLQL